MKLVILSSSNTNELQEEANKYDIHQVGSLSISNSQYFLTFVGSPKVTSSVEESKAIPKPSAKAKSK